MKGIWKYKEFWPEVDPVDLVTLGEGNTPLVPSVHLGKEFDIPNLYFKLETGNPTGSYKDRFAASALTHLVKNRARLCLATSSGNTGAALAAYSARSGLPCFLVIVDGAPSGKVNQMKGYGAKTLMVQGFGIDEVVSEDVFRSLKQFGLGMKSEVQISAYSYSPQGMMGVESIAFEIAEALPENCVKVFSPAGGGGLTLAIGKGFLEWGERDKSYRLPELYCVQPEGNNTIAGALINGQEKANPIKESKTKISGLQVPNVIDGNQTIEVCRRLNGGGEIVMDQQVFELQKALAFKEGIYCEPAGAVSLAGAIKARKAGVVNKSDSVVCVITGHGFKDPQSLQRMIKKEEDYFESIDGATKYIIKNLAN
ncbi:pyridoxal-phosphate dependent enzyme [Membranihabitans maritimus]|uniref:pyridoxal-phosphate dependent enzyme n=1 Tax=Membranihabitans maritimus TaxID=2904244 RepID=UPI001F2393F9|nr:pyridoxal-phosphate dependent enzyme [Membranihabitans maritimus]